MHLLPENRMCAPPFATKQRPPIWKILDPPLLMNSNRNSIPWALADLGGGGTLGMRAILSVQFLTFYTVCCHRGGIKGRCRQIRTGEGSMAGRSKETGVPDWVKMFWTRMHSSRMRTTRTVTIRGGSPSRGGVSLSGGVLHRGGSPSGGFSIWGGSPSGGVLHPGGVGPLHAGIPNPPVNRMNDRHV